MKKLLFGLTYACLATASVASAQPNPPSGPSAPDQPPDGHADEQAELPRMPARFSQRPLTVPKFTVVGSAGLAIAKVPGVDEVGVGASFGGAFGVTDNLEVGLVFLPLLLRPRARFGNPNLRGTYRLLDGGFELGISSSLSIPTADEDDVAVGFSLPMQFRGRRLRVQTGVGVGINFGEPDPTAALTIPLQLNLSVTEHLFARVRSGLNVLLSSLTGGSFSDRVVVPLGMSLGFTIPSGAQPLMDLSADIDWPVFLLPGAEDKVIQDLFTVSLSASFYFFL